jgi:hypothetical protein
MASVDNILSMLSRSHKQVQWNKDDVAEWAGECEKNIGEFHDMAQYKDYELEVVNRRAKLPCGLFRLILVIPTFGLGYLKYHQQGGYIIFESPSITNAFTINGTPPKEGTGKVRIDYIGIAIDEEGYPLICDGHEQAIYWYCLVKYYEVEFLTGKISGQAYDHIMSQYGHYVTKIKQGVRMRSSDDIDRINMVMYNQILSVRKGRLL